MWAESCHFRKLNNFFSCCVTVKNVSKSLVGKYFYLFGIETKKCFQFCPQKGKNYTKTNYIVNKVWQVTKKLCGCFVVKLEPNKFFSLKRRFAKVFRMLLGNLYKRKGKCDKVFSPRFTAEANFSRVFFFWRFIENFGFT